MKNRLLLLLLFFGFLIQSCSVKEIDTLSRSANKDVTLYDSRNVATAQVYEPPQQATQTTFVATQSNDISSPLEVKYDKNLGLKEITSQLEDVNTFVNNISKGALAGRKIAIPEDQNDVQTKCLENFNTLPEIFNEDKKTKTIGFNPYDFKIKHSAYDISYNFYHLNPNYVFHRIHKSNLQNSCGKRSNGFYADETLKNLRIPASFILTDSGFKGSGFDRGHMAPSGDFVWNQSINKESFYMTNMSPQTPGLNQKTWQKLESHIRRWACGVEELEVYTGPVLEKNLHRLKSCASIPRKYFKVLSYFKEGKHYGIAFLYPQTDNAIDNDPYESRALSIRELESLTGINFFEDKYSKEVQDSFETKFDLSDWKGKEQNCEACKGVLKVNED
ncbi:MAG: DNA/RNA non-specific endonuclease [Bdellovibrionaceae bacterium]|nr:DNA/RNA non-specific endonuclease [Pseudobdellovibrionaceae bacterium]NUM58117.1 DNA/RNA non-specific endonuclease [Pseudobdellovibrionaceae bacterium]